jgi:23S rRNA (uracil1939-C5)-methyltransferase
LISSADYNERTANPLFYAMNVAVIESLDHEGRGVTHVDGKVIFIEGALPGEQVRYESHFRKPKYEFAAITELLTGSSARVKPACAHFGVCGGCSMQHLDARAQTAVKQRVLEDALWHVGRIRPDLMYPPIAGPSWGYRYRARLSIKRLGTQGRVLIGFHQKRKSFIAPMDMCPILPPHVAALVPALKLLIRDMTSPDRFPQIEIAVGDTPQGRQTALVLRHLDPLNEADHQRLRDFADTHSIVWYLQPKGPDTAWQFYPIQTPPLAYTLDEFGCTMAFEPTDFTQVNHGVNQMLLRRAMGLLAPASGERIADLFCGLGNFTLPIARSGADVVGIEGSAALVNRALANAARNGLDARCTFRVANLFEVTEDNYAQLAAGGEAFDKWLVDPPRDGAAELMKAIPPHAGPKRIVYVSCSPSTLARDAAVLVHEKGYRLLGAGIANMFPQTSHVESIALFERTAQQT